MANEKTRRPRGDEGAGEGEVSSTYTRVVARDGLTRFGRFGSAKPVGRSRKSEAAPRYAAIGASGAIVDAIPQPLLSRPPASSICLILLVIDR